QFLIRSQVSNYLKTIISSEKEQKTLSEDSLSKSLDNLINKFKNPQPVVQEILHCTEGKQEQVDLIIQRILESEYPNDTKQETEWIQELVQEKLIKKLVDELVKDTISPLENPLKIDRQFLIQDRSRDKDNLEILSKSTKIVSGSLLFIFCIFVGLFFIFRKDSMQTTPEIPSSEKNSSDTETACLNQIGTISASIREAINESSQRELVIKDTEDWLQKNTLDEDCKDRLDISFNRLLDKYSYDLIEATLYKESLEYICKISEEYEYIQKYKDILEGWSKPDYNIPDDVRQAVRELNSSNCPVMSSVEIP
ncbi:hypothetical protein, partial [Spirulina sp. 06S082]|uniref:hypothetical protein n=1 Tax=Spirulina sp. 06S082 TaxID=3110248 RepID=UPI002B2011A7